MPITFGPDDLLEYDAINRVLICLACRYAIQKAALGSHLLRHKVYRGERQRMLSAISRLELAEPDQVQLPPANGSPVRGLPILAGFRCAADGCERLCASLKRMRRHWSESHGVSDPVEPFCCAVSLQTFFRGTKLRYFEVASPGAGDQSPSASGDDSVNGVGQEHRLDLGDVATSTDQTPRLPQQPPSFPFNLDLEMLKYFYHFTTATSLTLPSQHDDPAKHWQTNAVAQALDLHWLMCGLLAISASHLASLSNTATAKRAHQQRSSQFFGEFHTGWNLAKSDSGTAAKTGAQIVCVRRCCYYAFLDSPATDRSTALIARPFELPSFMATVQGCADPEFALRLETSDTADNTLEQTISRFTRNESTVTETSQLTGTAPPEMLERLRTLPYRMAAALQKPDSARDYFEVLCAINALAECWSMSYAADDAATTWLAMQSWLARLSDRFMQMLSRGNPATLIVLAYWSPLVERAERHSWFLRGLAARLHGHVVRELPDDSAVKSLVEDLKA
ncbi:hypothetical protein B0J13DRAFT_596741 [Dactylonectria estremocensis]|uniref:C2H2-type domain-containing protein n=1 Tax=Dactylonectria estremocensis TaxID=1079267 RepID=A0A9P9IZJ7_9HYPO|nr:hypothetical protein B0J13DRAFT_596741 [Dactylonectria estremocensis]